MGVMGHLLLRLRARVRLGLWAPWAAERLQRGAKPLAALTPALPSLAATASTRAACRQMYTDAYMITKEAARAALAMVEEDDSLDVEGVLLALQDRGRCFTTLPKLALQRWDDSDIQSGGRVRGIAKWYATSYHATFQEALYHDWDDCVI